MFLVTSARAIRTQETFSEERASPKTSVFLQKGPMLVVDADCCSACQKLARTYQVQRVSSREKRGMRTSSKPHEKLRVKRKTGKTHKKHSEWSVFFSKERVSQG